MNVLSKWGLLSKPSISTSSPKYYNGIIYTPYLPGESLNSWFIRYSAINSTRISELTRKLDYIANSDDFDQGYPNQVITNLTQILKSFYEIYNFTEAFQLMNTVLFSNHAHLLLHNCIKKIYHYCPLCLANEVPFFRIKWRTTFHYICEVHECWMRTRCENCGHPIVIQSPVDLPQSESAREVLAYCSACHSDLRSHSIVIEKDSTLCERIIDMQYQFWDKINYNIKSIHCSKLSVSYDDMNLLKNYIEADSSKLNLTKIFGSNIGGILLNKINTIQGIS